MRFQPRKLLIVLGAIGAAALVVVLFTVLSGQEPVAPTAREGEPYSLDVLSQQKRWVSTVEGQVDTLQDQVTRLRTELDVTKTLISNVRDDLLNNMEQLHSLSQPASRQVEPLFQSRPPIPHPTGDASRF